MLRQTDVNLYKKIDVDFRQSRTHGFCNVIADLIIIHKQDWRM